jgi:RNA 2',3'-cyclic 3'-phosphodiesterase
VRLFVAVWPPPEVVGAIAALSRPEVPGVRWTTPDQWHVTLRFLGEVEDPAVVRDRLRGVTPDGVEARMGPSSRRLGQAVLCVPVTGLDELAVTVTSRTADVGLPPEDRPFFGHLTLARLQRGAHPAALRRVPRTAVSESWNVTEVTVVRSHLGGEGSRYEVVGHIAAG